jgi:hypothetical protein
MKSVLYDRELPQTAVNFTLFCAKQSKARGGAGRGRLLPAVSRFLNTARATVALLSDVYINRKRSVCGYA